MLRYKYDSGKVRVWQYDFGKYDFGKYDFGSTSLASTSLACINDIKYVKL